MRLIETGIPGLVVIEPVVHGDRRGFFMESWHAGRYRALGLPGSFVQSNLSRSAKGVIRGLHYQYPQPQGKLVSVLEGRASTSPSTSGPIRRHFGSGQPWNCRLKIIASSTFPRVSHTAFARWMDQCC